MSLLQALQTFVLIRESAIGSRVDNKQRFSLQAAQGQRAAVIQLDTQRSGQYRWRRGCGALQYGMAGTGPFSKSHDQGIKKPQEATA